ncbi:hypothetical protein CONPUDRAFT_87953 [Coniophora puteana RWD-64-598 SS2]|uniref:Uncharacterized protein n=1 Tax=Coniophora puteana (strain RWD-64-598) TaxID=741705 RepID=A0A5M3N2C6_CONPW|nr:uncharacterized protein CONPUDRAFT_87953 [Coniophora puteana RWD-64-598 SS2]EIW85540.1 hypothetical protein CONPUDRAFT_87953 [Coniophora puteana RWD-64-598 SS2]
MLALQPFVSLYRTVLAPIAPLAWLGLPVSTLDVVAAVRLCVALRQLREGAHRDHITARARITEKDGQGVRTLVEPEERSFVRDLATTLTVVYGGEALAYPLLGLTPSFMLSGVGVALYAAAQAVVEVVPALPQMSLQTEFPLSFVDGFTRAILLCTLIPPAIVGNPQPAISNSPWALALSSLIIANGGFFITNLVSFLHPTPLALTTPPELRPYGWTTTDLWAAPLITSIYALLTHAQPFWQNVHAIIGGALDADGKLAPALDDEGARAACALLLATMFTVRTVRNFGAVSKDVREKIKTQ